MAASDTSLGIAKTETVVSLLIFSEDAIGWHLNRHWNEECFLL